jgi:hypothetical protein
MTLFSQLRLSRTGLIQASALAQPKSIGLYHEVAPDRQQTCPEAGRVAQQLSHLELTLKTCWNYQGMVRRFSKKEIIALLIIQRYRFVGRVTSRLASALEKLQPFRFQTSNNFRMEVSQDWT